MLRSPEPRSGVSSVGLYLNADPAQAHLFELLCMAVRQAAQLLLQLLAALLRSGQLVLQVSDSCLVLTMISRRLQGTA